MQGVEVARDGCSKDSREAALASRAGEEGSREQR